mmetsp:Transcript_4687/g.11787  ORF Transcript_4687/g.11787 Transcript_4687/m.11787 type:complete len:207 (+) Transcript_4687:77-697(+)
MVPSNVPTPGERERCLGATLGHGRRNGDGTPRRRSPGCDVDRIFDQVLCLVLRCQACRRHGLFLHAPRVALSELLCVLALALDLDLFELSCTEGLRSRSACLRRRIGFRHRHGLHSGVGLNRGIGLRHWLSLRSWLRLRDCNVYACRLSGRLGAKELAPWSASAHGRAGHDGRPCRRLLSCRHSGALILRRRARPRSSPLWRLRAG